MVRRVTDHHSIISHLFSLEKSLTEWLAWHHVGRCKKVYLFPQEVHRDLYYRIVLLEVRLVEFTLGIVSAEGGNDIEKSAASVSVATVLTTNFIFLKLHISILFPSCITFSFLQYMLTSLIVVTGYTCGLGSERAG